MTAEAGVLARDAEGEPGLLAKERTVAAPGFSRWLVPPAALCIHLCIGMAYGFSVFWLPLSRAVGLKQSLVCAADMSLWARMFETTCDWKISELGWMFTIFLFSSAARPLSGVVGSNAWGLARQVSSPHCAGAAAWFSVR